MNTGTVYAVHGVIGEYRQALIFLGFALLIRNGGEDGHGRSVGRWLMGMLKL
jgi:hypothetical protein